MRRIAGDLVFAIDNSHGLLALAAVLICATAFAERFACGVGRQMRRFARRRAAAIAFVGLISFGLSLSLSWVRWPVPRIHDEFSHLLLGDTLARGRLANPTHPMWQHIEQAHAIYEPTYASKYPPGTGMALAVGQAGFGTPAVGLWLATAAACMALCWMLMGWMSPRWAMLGGLLAASHPVVLSWSHVYIGGAMPMLAGSLLLGGWVRLLSRPTTASGIGIGAGLSLLALTRPAEGLILACVLALHTAVLLRRQATGHGLGALWRAVRPAAVILATTGGFMGYYNLQVTGSALTLPYAAHAQKYAVAPNFVFQSLRVVPEHRHEQLRALHAVWEVSEYQQHRSARGYARIVYEKAKWLARQLFQSELIALSCLLVPFLIRRSWQSRLSIIAGGLFLATILLAQVFVNTYYVGAAAGLLATLVVSSLRHLRAWRGGGRKLGKIVVRAAIALHLLAAAEYFAERYQDDGWEYTRAALQQRLAADGRKHLVIVRYGAGHDLHEEWVANGADIDGAAVVWARDMGSTGNRELLDYFADRQIWLLDVSTSHSPVPYSEGTGSDDGAARR